MRAARRVGATMILASVGLAPIDEAVAQEVLIEADGAPRPPEQRGRKIHGDVSLGVAFGFITEDPIASIEPALGLDLRDVVPLEIQLGAPLRLRIYDRSPEQGQVIRGTDWDEAGDYLAILQKVHYADGYAFGERGQASLSLRVGALGRVQLGHGSIVSGYANSLDLDRRRTGFDGFARVEGALLEHEAGVEAGLIVGDLAGGQIFGGRVAVDWAGAALGFSVVGDPTAPRALSLGTDLMTGVAIDRRNRPISTGDRGVTALGLELAYRFSDRWHYLITPYLDLNLMPGIGRGLHLGADLEFVLGRHRRVRLGARGEMTAGSSHYDPTYFDVFYGMQRWQAPFVATAGDLPADAVAFAQPKSAFVRAQDLGGIGGYGGLRFAHEDGAFVETGFRYRPGPLGQTWETRVGVELEVVRLSLLLAHRGSLGFNVLEPAGTLASLDLAVPFHAYFEATARAGWLHAVRRVPGATAAAKAASEGFVGGAGLVLLGVAGRFPW